MMTSLCCFEHGKAVRFRVRRFTVYMKLASQGQKKPSKHRNFLASITEKVPVYKFTHEQIPNRIEAFTESVYRHLVFTLGLQRGIRNSNHSPILEKMSSWTKSSSQICKVDAHNVIMSRHKEVLGKY